MCCFLPCATCGAIVHRSPLAPFDPQPTRRFILFRRTEPTSQPFNPQAGVECTKEYLEGSEGGLEVVNEYQKGIRTHGITGVPFFVISNESKTATVPLSGGQPPAAFIEAFEALS